VSFNDGSLESMLFNQNFNADDMLESQSITDNASDGNSLDMDSELLYRKRFGSKGRNMSASVSFGLGDDEIDADLNSVNDFPRAFRTDSILQNQFQKDDGVNYGIRLSYTEPLGKRKYLELNYERQNYDNESLKDVSDIDPLTGIGYPNSDLSNHYNRDYTFDRGGFTFLWNKPKVNFSAGLSIQNSQLKGNILDNEVSINKNYVRLLPNMRWRIELASARNLRIDYSTSFNEPSLEQLQPIVDNSDPLNIYIGNPELKPEYSQRLRVRFHSFSQFSFTSIFASVTARYTENKITNAKSIDELFRTVITPVNVEDDFTINGFAHFGTPLRFINVQFGLNANTSFNRGTVFVNNVQNDFDRWTQGFGIRLNNRNTDVLDVGLRSNWTYNQTKYSEDESLDSDFLKSWSFSSRFTYALYTGNAFDENQDVPILGASISKYFFDDKRVELKFSVYDLFDENRGVSRTSNLNYIEDVHTNSLGRYFMLSCTYTLKGFGQMDMSHGRRMHMIRH
jgi:hypothetical protein